MFQAFPFRSQRVLNTMRENQFSGLDIMGSEHSMPMPQPPTDFPFFTITFNIPDKLKIVNAGGNAPEISDVIGAAVENDYNGKIEAVLNEDGATSVRISDNPFAHITFSKTQAVRTRLLLCGLLRRLRDRGWQLLASTDLSREYYTSTWIFQRNTDIVDRGSRSPPIICVSLSSTNQLTLVNGSPELFEVLQKCVNGVSGSSVTMAEQLTATAFNVSIAGKPWENNDFVEGIKARMILINIFRKFNAMNLVFRGSCNVKGTADCLFFQQATDTKPTEQQFAVLSLNAKNCLRLVNFPSSVYDVIKQCVLDRWPAGLEADNRHTEVVSELQLVGKPWSCEGQQAAAARLLITAILQALLANGWAVHTALEVSRKINNKGIFVFRSCPPASLPHMALAPEDKDKIRLINAPDDVKQAMAWVLQKKFPSDGIKSEGPSYGGHEWRLAHSPWHTEMGATAWSSSNNLYALAPNLVAHLLLAFRRLGWLLVCSADVSARFAPASSEASGFPLDVHTLFFVHIGQPAKDKPQTSTSTAEQSTSKGPVDEDAPPPAYDQIA